MRTMTQTMLGSPVPVIVHVAPAGAQAASAGMFLPIAAHVAAMVPGSNIGAAHPVGLGGRSDPVTTDKLVNDGSALAPAIADRRGRNADWAERAVRESAAVSARQALALGVIDLLAEDRAALLRALDGRTVTPTAGPRVLRTAGAAR